nr:hypothetical protein [Xanthomonas citri]
MKYIWIVILAAGFAAVSDRAEAVAIRCETCQVDGDFRAEAVRAGPGTHIVYSVSNNLVQQWYVGSGGGGGTVPARAGAASTPVVRKQTAPGGATQEISKAHTFHVIAGGTIRPIYNIPVAMLGLNPDAREKTAYDYVTDTNLRGMVEGAAGSSVLIDKVTGSSVMGALTDLLQLVTNYTGVRDQARLIFRIVFKDGSYDSVIVDLAQANGKSEPGSERTAAGQTIPKQASELSGTWTNYGGDNLAPMVALIQRFGGTVSFSGSGGTGGTITRIVCVTQTCTVERSAY